MSHTLSYDSHMCGQYIDHLDEDIEDAKSQKKQIEEAILALICMDPSKVRNSKKSKKDYDEDYDWMNNAQYLLHQWEELRSEWEECMYKIIRGEDAQDAIKDQTREVDVCPECLRELEWVKKQREDGFWNDVLTCPICKKEFQDINSYPQDDSIPKPSIVTIKTFSEG